MTLVLIAGVLYLVNQSGEKTVFTFDSLFKKYASHYGLDWLMLKAICMNESSLGLHPRVLRGLQVPHDIEGSKSMDGKSWGIMQVTIPTARDFDPTATEQKLNNPEYSINIASQYIAWCFKRFSHLDPRQIEWVVKSYNQGVGNTNKEIRGEKLNPDVVAYWEKYKRNYAKAKVSA